ncbi:hypothetical protein BJX96DRAFT_151959 [Aspergillus floccosus]
MLKLLSKIARRLGLVVVHITVVRSHHGEIRILQSTFPRYSREEVSIDSTAVYESPCENMESSETLFTTREYDAKELMEPLGDRGRGEMESPASGLLMDKEGA